VNAKKSETRQSEFTGNWQLATNNWQLILCNWQLILSNDYEP